MSLLTGAPVVAASQPAAAAARPGRSAPGPAIGTVHPVSQAAQQAAEAFWTPARMAAAQGEAAQGHASKASPPPGTPTARPFGGVPTIGALFYTTGSGAHFCTASVVDSEHEDLIVTAAHCVYASGYSANIEFVPG